jgi:hypothetical protein
MREWIEDVATLALMVAASPWVVLLAVGWGA